MEKRTDVLKKLDPFMFDFMLNNPVTLCKNCKLCDNVNGMKKNEPWFKFLCYQLVRNLETAETINSTNHVDKKLSRCKSLAYWMYDKVNSYDNSSIKNKENLIDELLGVWNKFNDTSSQYASSSRCNIPESSEYKNLEEMKRKKIMSDYCENYSEFRKILKRYANYPNCHIYYDYFRDSLSNYKETVKECRRNDFFIYNCSYLCSNSDPEDLLNKGNCRTIEISNEKNEYVKKDECESFMKPAPALSCESESIKISEFTFSDNRAIILLLFSLWDILLTFFFLYKITPFRSWINSKIGKKKIIGDSFNEQSDDETLDDDYENLDRNMQNAGYNITYNSNWSSSR
ncbi:PIR protein [Plasmodium ovale]|uniref:PIR protein n=1 Tax=Plasmodium ovale TaxID=36330 RepID=A0A1C3KJJ6_PLAOA|nr:PIR protein [Plasmodium ovale]